MLQSLNCSLTSACKAGPSLRSICRAIGCSVAAGAGSLSCAGSDSRLAASLSTPVKRSRRVPLASTSANTGCKDMPISTSFSSRPTRLVLMRTPSASSTTASFCGISSMKSGKVAMRVTV
ncbi:hypothetical protein D9M71_625500 [compost metagenome]